MKIRILVTTAFTLAFTSSAHAQLTTATALTNTNTLVSFSVFTPGILIGAPVPITGTGSDVLVGIDYRPLDGQLIGLGYNSAAGTASVYSINRATGVATSINSGLALGPGLGRIMADFNPTANALRITTSAVSPANNNFRSPTGGTGALVADSALNPGAPVIRATAYSRNNAGGGTNGATTLYAIDQASGSLVSQGSIDFSTGGGQSPNTGTINAVAVLSGVAASNVIGFDIFNFPNTAAGNPGTAFLATGTQFHMFNLTTGAAGAGMTIGGGVTITDFALVPIPEPGSLALCAVAAAIFVRYRPRRSAA
jgi:hypothetical protein